MKMISQRDDVMMNQAPFGVVSHYPHENRSEHINIGIIAWQNGNPRFHLASDLKRLRAFDPSVNVSKLRSWEETLPSFLQDMGLDSMESQHRFLRQFGRIKLSENLGVISFYEEVDYLEKVSMMLNLLTAPHKKEGAIREEKSRLTIELKNLFRLHEWLGNKPDDINKHLIVPNYVISQEEDLVSDFCLKNGVLHAIQSVDFRTENTSNKKQEARSKSLILNIAQDELNAKTYTVIAGDTTALHPSIKLLERYSDVINWDNRDDREVLVNHLAKTTGKPMLDWM